MQSVKANTQDLYLGKLEQVQIKHENKLNTCECQWDSAK